MLWTFAEQVSPDLDNYSFDDAWNLTLDEFVQWIYQREGRTIKMVLYSPPECFEQLEFSLLTSTFCYKECV